MASTDNINVTIYLLKLSKGKYYVGSTTKDIDDEYANHLSGLGGEWTKLYPPVKVLEHFTTSPKFLDLVITRAVNKYGIDNVRSCYFNAITLSEKHKKLYNNSPKSLIIKSKK